MFIWAHLVNPTLTGAMMHVAGCGYLLRCKAFCPGTHTHHIPTPRPCVCQCCGGFRFNMGLGLPTRHFFFFIVFLLWQLFVPSCPPPWSIRGHVIVKNKYFVQRCGFLGEICVLWLLAEQGK